jgi:hypothetical protein
MFGSDNPIDGLDTLGNPIYEAYLRNKVKLPGRLYHNLDVSQRPKALQNPPRLKQNPLGFKRIIGSPFHFCFFFFFSFV